MIKEIDEAVKRVRGMKLKEIKHSVNETAAETYLRLSTRDRNRFIDKIIKVIKNY